MITTITTDVHLVTTFRAVDERGDAVQIETGQGSMNTLTPLAAMELYEKLHAARNEARRKAGLAEIATPDEGLILLAALRRFKDITPSLETIAEVVCELVGQVTRDRGHGPQPPDEEDPPTEQDWALIERIKGMRRGTQQPRGFVAGEAETLAVPCVENGQEAAEVT